MTPPRASVGGAGAEASIFLGEQKPIPSHVAAIPGLGDVLFHHAIASTVSEISVVSAKGCDDRIALQLATAPCDCGCGARGRGLLLTPGAEEARMIARQLVEMAEKYEAIAAAAAGAAFARAAGR